MGDGEITITCPTRGSVDDVEVLTATRWRRGAVLLALDRSPQHRVWLASERGRRRR